MTIGIYKDKSYYKLERYDMNSKYIIDTAENKKFLKVFKIVTGIIIEINICQIRLNRNYKNKCCIKGNIKL